MKNCINYVSRICASALLAGASAGLYAQVQLEEIVVTAQKREQSLQDVPISVNVVGGDKIAEAGIDRVEDLQAYVPNLTFSETGIGNNLFIRGLGSGINSGFEQSASQFFDGVHFGRSQLARAPIFDVERVEVLRGPQSILFGKNAIAGAISTTSARPTDEFEAEFSALFEPDHGEVESTGIISGALTETFKARLAVRYRGIDGYIDNPNLSAEETDREELTVRLSTVWEPTDNTSVYFKYERNEFDVTGRQIEILSDEFVPGSSALAALLNPLGLPFSEALVVGFGQDPSGLDVTQNFSRSSNGDFSNNEIDNFTIQVDHQFGEIQFTSTTAYLQYEFEELCDCDFISANIFSLPIFEEYDQFSQEIRFTSPGGQTLDWIAGAFFQTNEVFQTDTLIVDEASVLAAVSPAFAGTAGPRQFGTDTDSFAAFGQVTWNITDRFRATLGLRYTDEQKDGFRNLTATQADGSDFDSVADLEAAQIAFGAIFDVQLVGHDLTGSRSDTSFDWAFNAQYDITDQTNIYFSAATGFKAGGFDARSNQTPDPSVAAADIANPALAGVTAGLAGGAFEFEEEEALAFELGVKTGLFNGRAELNASFFLTDYEDLQISIFDGTLGFNVGNAAEATVFGVELEGRAQLTESISLNASLAFLDFEFDDFANGECFFGEPDPEGDGLCDRTGFTNQYVADFSGSVGLQHYTTLGDKLALRTALDANFSDSFLTAQNLDPATEQDAYVRVNLRVGLSDVGENWEVALLGRNLNNAIVIPYTNPVPLSSTFGSNSSYGFVERPRNIAIQGTYRF